MKISNPVLHVKEVKDPIIQKNFENLNKHFDANNQMVDFRHIEFVTTKAVTNLKVAHNLGYKPKDLIRLKFVGAGRVTFNYDKFDENFLDVTTTDAVRVRLFVGTYKKDESTEDDETGDLEKWVSDPATAAQVAAAIAAASSDLASATAFRAPEITRFTATGAGTYSIPEGALYLRVRAVGGGGGGGGSGSSGGSAGTAGTVTTFGGVIIICAGGGGGGVRAAAPGAGGTASVAIGTNIHKIVELTGGTGGMGGSDGGSNEPGGMGASTPFGGAGGGGGKGGAPTDAVANTGSGGGGGGMSVSPLIEGGTGGSAGGYVEAIIAAPFGTTTYATLVGSKGTKGAAGPAGTVGSDGATGFIVVEAHFQ